MSLHVFQYFKYFFALIFITGWYIPPPKKKLNKVEQLEMKRCYHGGEHIYVHSYMLLFL